MRTPEESKEAIGKVVAGVLDRDPAATQTDAEEVWRLADGGHELDDAVRAQVHQAYRWEVYRRRADERRSAEAADGKSSFFEASAEAPEWRRQRPIWLVCTLSVMTLGWYPLIWFGLSWKEMKRELRDERMTPFGHALAMSVAVYGIFRMHAHFRVLKEMRLAIGMDGGIHPWWVVLTYTLAFILIPLASVAGIPQSVLPTVLIYHIVTIVIIAHGQASLNAYWQALPDRTVPIRVTRGEWVALVAPFPTWVFLTTVLPPGALSPVLSAWTGVFVAMAVVGVLLAGTLLFLLHQMKAQASARRAAVCFVASLVFLIWGAFAILEPLTDGRGQVVGVVTRIEKKPSIESQLSFHRLTLGLQQQIEEFVIPANGGRPETRVPVRHGRASVTLELHPSEPGELDIESLAVGNTIRATYRHNDFVAEALELLDEGRSRLLYSVGPPVAEITLGLVCLAVGAMVGMLGMFTLRSGRTRPAAV